MNEYIITYDLGTTSLKTCLFKINGNFELIAGASEGYPLEITDNGGVEQDPMDWWNAMCSTTKRVVSDSGINHSKIKGISFCAQMQGVVLVDHNGDPVRKAMSYMDNRGQGQMDDAMGGGPSIDGINIFKLLKSIHITGVAATSAKDPVYRYLWVRENEPENFKKIHKWLDVKEFVIAKATGEFVMTEDSAFATLLMDARKNRRTFSHSICKMFKVEYGHLPKIIKSTDIAGELTSAAAGELGLIKGIPVFGGGGDASLIGVGSGAVHLGDTHIYMGTSGWVSTVIDKQKIDINHKIAGIVGADDMTFNYFAELETAGKCIEWVKDHLSYEETVDYIVSSEEMGYEELNTDLYEYMMESISDVPAGSNGVIFTPWLHGSRCPFEDTSARGMFFNIGLETGKRDLIHAVLEGVCYHLRWQLESSANRIKTNDIIRFAGGGALAEGTCQLLTDITGHRILVIKEPQNAGAIGAAVLASVGLGRMKDLTEATEHIEIRKEYVPNPYNKVIHDERFNIFKSLYYNNKKLFRELNH